MALVVALGLLRGLPVMQMVIFSIALAVAVVPEALPAVVTISLALGAQRMVQRNASCAACRRSRRSAAPRSFARIRRGR